MLDIGANKNLLFETLVPQKKTLVSQGQAIL